jgi:hypothetical protein
LSTFLQLVNKLSSESGISGAPAAITSVIGQTGMALRMVNWTIASYREIQGRSAQWRWLRSTFSFPTVAGTDTYAYNAAGCIDTRLGAPITRFRGWIPFGERGESNISRYLTAGGVPGQMWMTFLPWSIFRAMYKFGPMQLNQSTIIHVTITPQNQLMIGPNPNEVFTVLGEYQMAAQILAADGDVPEMPEDYHDLIFYRAMEKYGRFQAAPEVVARGETEGGRIMRALEQGQLPQLLLAAPLA